jgi:hypothetical protein
MRNTRKLAGPLFCTALYVAAVAVPASAFAQVAPEFIGAVKTALLQCGEFKTAGYDFRNYKDAEGNVWLSGRQQDVYHYQDVREAGGVLTVVEWVGHVRDFQPYGSRVRAGGYVSTATVRAADLGPNPAVVEMMTPQNQSRGLWAVRIACRTARCITTSQRPLLPTNISDHRIPLAQWQPSGIETQHQSDAWNLEMCEGNGMTSRQRAEDLQRRLQAILR